MKACNSCKHTLITELESYLRNSLQLSAHEIPTARGMVLAKEHKRYVAKMSCYYTRERFLVAFYTSFHLT